MKSLAIIAALLLAGAAGCRSHRSASETGVASVQVLRMERAESLLRVGTVIVDSPEVVIEWPDSPRRRVTARARRVRGAAQERRATATTVRDTVTVTATAARNTESRPGSPPLRLWFVGCLACLGLGFLLGFSKKSSK